MSHAYGPAVPDSEAIQSLQRAFEMGYRHFDTATLYGSGDNELRVGQALRGIRDEVFLASKCGMANVNGVKTINGRPDTLKRQCEQSLKRLQTDHINLYYLHRKDPDVPIEESVGALNDLVQEGKIGAIGLSEVSADTLYKAHHEASISALQSEYSLWTRNPEIATLQATQALGIAFVAFSPLGRGFLTNRLPSIASLDEGDIRRQMPRFAPQHFSHNAQWLRAFVAMADQIGCTPAQLALAWLLHQGEHIVAIPGSRSTSHMQDNLEATHLLLTHEQIAELNDTINPSTVSGERYSDAMQLEIDTEAFAKD